MITAAEARTLTQFGKIEDDIAYKKQYPAELQKVYDKIKTEASQGSSFAYIETQSRRLALDIQKDLELSGFKVIRDSSFFFSYLAVSWYS